MLDLVCFTMFTAALRVVCAFISGILEVLYGGGLIWVEVRKCVPWHHYVTLDTLLGPLSIMDKLDLAPLLAPGYETRTCVAFEMPFFLL